MVARAPKRRFVPVLPRRSSLIILALSLVAYALARVPLPVIAFFVPTVVTLAIIADIATVGVLSLLASVLDVFFILWSAERFSVAWYASRFLYTAGSTFVLYSAVLELIAANRRRGAVAVLMNTHAERLAALWEKTAQAGTHDAGLQSVLAEGAEALRAGQLFYGRVGHVEGHEFVIDSHVLRTGPDGGVPTATVSKTGDRIPVAFDDLSVRRLRPGRPRS